MARIADDVPEGKVTDFPRSVKAEDDETVVFAWITYESRADRDRVNAAIEPLTAPTGPDVTGPVLWTSDRYGSRFAVTAPITTAEDPVRWYLWDIDVCGHEALTVHSGYHPDWTQWLATRNATAPELADRCQPYAHGRPHPELGDDDTKVDYLARVIE